VNASRAALRHAIFVAGPTSVGKSAVALQWAARAGAEIVNGDAFQLYREFPVLAAQPAEAELSAVPHHLFGTVSCTSAMDAARYAGLALEVIHDIVARGRIPLVVGGSGLYLHALMAGLPDLPPIEPAVRERVRALALPAMVEQLRALDPDSMNVIDLQNPRRVARRLELSLQSGRPASALLTTSEPPAGMVGVVFVRDRDDLQARIARAVAARLDGGAIDEVRAARATAGATARQILGWREIGAHLDGQLSSAGLREQLTTATRRYAKRQLTWFRGKSTFPVVNLSTVTPDALDRTARQLGLP
jgi:tRNA dimethylallyltransferase